MTSSAALRRAPDTLSADAHSERARAPHRSSPGVLLLLFAIWCACNNLFALHAHHILNAHSHIPLLFIDLSALQILLGLCMSFLLSNLTAPAPHKPGLSSPPPDWQRPSSRTLYTSLSFLVAFFHLAGTQLSNYSYALIGSTSTLVWKLTEPLSSVLLKRLILREATSMLSLFGMSLVLLGALLFSAATLSITFSPVILANFFFPLRNILLKYEQYNAPQPASSAHTYLRLSECALPLSLLALLLKNVALGVHIPPLAPLLHNALLYNAYQLASLALLQRMDVLTHSLANTLKRFSAIALTAVVTGELFTPTRCFALLLTAVGFPLHVMAKYDLQPRLLRARLGVRSVMPAALLVVVAVAAFANLSPLQGFMQRFPLSTHQQHAVYGEAGHDEALSQPNVVHDGALSPPTAVRDEALSPSIPDDAVSALTPDQVSDTAPSDLTVQQESLSEVTPRFVISPSGEYKFTTDVYHSEEEALTFPDTNCGNMVWEFAGYRKLVDFTKSVTCNDTHINCNFQHPEMKDSRMVHYRPAANGFNRKMNLTFDDAHTRLQYEGDVVLYVGIGMQHEFKDDDTKNDMYRGETIDNTVETFRFTDEALKLLKVMNERQIPMFMRGDFTLQASRLAGYEHGVSTGCPSLFINENIRLGALLEEKYRSIKNRKGKPLKIAFNLTGRHRLFKWMMSIADLNPGSLFYAQGPEDFRVLRNHNISFDRVRFYGNMPDWMESLSHMDLSIGPRIHGNMAAVAAGVPVFVVAPDFRVLEMAQRMKIPHTHMYDESLTDGMDVTQLFSDMEFDGSAFDENRCQIAKLYREHFGKFGLHLSQHVEQISHIC